MAATQKLLVDILVTAAAVAGRQFGRDDEPVMFLFLLSGRWLMTIEAIHTFLSMQAHLVFVHYGILNSRVAFCALAASTDQFRARLLGFHLWSRPID
jgi:hypothetical protein